MKKGERRKEEIVRAAEELFFRDGYQRTTVAGILGQTGGSKGSFYHHFESKLALLTEIAQRRLLAGYERFRKEDQDLSGLRHLNALLYSAFPIRSGEAPFLAALMGLRLREEGAEVFERMKQTARSLYLPPFREVLRALAAEEKASLPVPGLEILVWECVWALGDEMLKEGCRAAPDGALPSGRLSDLLRAARFILERTLDLEYGSVVILETEELLTALRQALQTLRSGREARRSGGLPCQSGGGAV